MHVRVRVCQYSNRREFDLHVGVLELTQACLLWDKSSGLTSILKRSGLSLTHTHTHTKMHTEPKVHKHVFIYTNTHGEEASACQNSEPCQIRRSLCTLCPSSLERDCLKHTRTHTQHLGSCQNSRELAVLPGRIFYHLSTHKHTPRQGHWCIKLFWSVYGM